MNAVPDAPERSERSVAHHPEPEGHYMSKGSLGVMGTSSRMARERAMGTNGGVIEFISEGGFGSEANIRLELRTEFPGIGGTIITREGVASALREEFNRFPKAGHCMFLRHTIIKKLEDHFYRTGVYKFAHIPRPLGSISRTGEHPYEAYIYEWAFGTEGFPWYRVDRYGNAIVVRLRDWDKFVANFDQTGIYLGRDCTTSEDARISQNIIHQYPKPIGDGSEMSSLWKRIDFGFASITIDFERLSRFLHDNREALIKTLRSERYEMVLLAVQYLTDRDSMKEIDIGRLEVLIGEYRRSSLTHYAMGFDPTITPVYFGARTESLI